MKDKYELILESLRANPKKWLVTGVAGFIGSNLLETLLSNGQFVVGLDNFATGHQKNLDEVKELVGTKWINFEFIEGDIRDVETCRTACDGVNYVLHQAALGSVPRSVKDPISTNSTNIDGFLNLLVAARDMQVESFVYAASSSTYGDHPSLPKVEETIGKPLSPYAVTKLVNELYADVFDKVHGFKTIGLRYFNVFGKRQDPNGSYAAVIPKWTYSILKNKDIVINGDGETSRDFCYIENVVQANVLSATKKIDKCKVYNVACGEKTTLNELSAAIIEIMSAQGINYNKKVEYQEFRVGDVKHSQANIEKAKNELGYIPKYSALNGLKLAIPWYIENIK